jgi:hypothetical protein
MLGIRGQRPIERDGRQVADDDFAIGSDGPAHGRIDLELEELVGTAGRIAINELMAVRVRGDGWIVGRRDRRRHEGNGCQCPHDEPGETASQAHSPARRVVHMQIPKL